MTKETPGLGLGIGPGPGPGPDTGGGVGGGAMNSSVEENSSSSRERKQPVLVEENSVSPKQQTPTSPKVVPNNNNIVGVNKSKTKKSTANFKVEEEIVNTTTNKTQKALLFFDNASVSESEQVSGHNNNFVNLESESVHLNNESNIVGNQNQQVGGHNDVDSKTNASNKNEGSDSEETFVYEKTTALPVTSTVPSSTNNLYTPSASAVNTLTATNSNNNSTNEIQLVGETANAEKPILIHKNSFRSSVLNKPSNVLNSSNSAAPRAFSRTVLTDNDSINSNSNLGQATQSNINPNNAIISNGNNHLAKRIPTNVSANPTILHPAMRFGSKNAIMMNNLHTGNHSTNSGGVGNSGGIGLSPRRNVSTVKRHSANSGITNNSDEEDDDNDNDFQSFVSTVSNDNDERNSVDDYTNNTTFKIISPGHANSTLTSDRSPNRSSPLRQNVLRSARKINRNSGDNKYDQVNESRNLIVSQVRNVSNNLFNGDKRYVKKKISFGNSLDDYEDYDLNEDRDYDSRYNYDDFNDGNNKSSVRKNRYFHNNDDGNINISNNNKNNNNNNNINGYDDYIYHSNFDVQDNNIEWNSRFHFTNDNDNDNDNNNDNVRDVNNNSQGIRAKNNKISRERKLINDYYDEDYYPIYGSMNNNYSPHNYVSTKIRYNKTQNFLLKFFKIIINLLIFGFLIFSLNKIFVIKFMDNPIANFEIRKIERLIITENMLIFDVNCMAKNYNLQDVSIDGSDLDIFIQTSHYDDPDDSESSLNKALSAKPKLEKTILLGNVKEFFVPLQFPGLMNNKNYGSPINNPNLDHHISTEGLGDLWHNLFHKDEIKPTVSIGQIKLTEFKLNLDPIISENFKLLIRGSFKYKLRGHNRLISVSKSLQVDKSKA